MSTFLCTIAGRWSLESPWLDPLLIQSIYVQGSPRKVSIYGIRPWPKITTILLLVRSVRGSVRPGGGVGRKRRVWGGEVR